MFEQSHISLDFAAGLACTEPRISTAIDVLKKPIAGPSENRMQIRSVLYVSEVQLVPSEAEQQIWSIAVTSRVNNEMAGVTGCLVYTGTHFAQIIEGSSSAIGALLLRLQVDSRHSRMKIIADIYQSARSCPEWSMAYSRAPQLSGMIARMAEGRVGGSDETVLAALLRRTVQGSS